MASEAMTPDRHPVVLWELTRACGLRCYGCPNGSGPAPEWNELTTYEAYKTVDQIAEVEPRELMITGGDPLERDDVYQIIEYATRRGLDPGLVLSPSDRLTWNVISRLQANGLTRVVMGIDGSTSKSHEAVHGVRGSFAHTLRAMRWAECAMLAIEVNTLVCPANWRDLAAIADLLRPFPIHRWNFHFLVPAGGSRQIPMITAQETELAFALIDDIRRREKFAVRVIEAPHYLRFRITSELEERLRNPDWTDFDGYRSDDTLPELLASIREGSRGFIYISHAGDVRPSEFAPLSAGNLRYRSLATIYRGSDLFVALRDPANLKGRCGQCDYRHLCGGSRARSGAMTGDFFASDSLCLYQPSSGHAALLTSREAS
ncbi:MAG TPA: radical SAM protein [Thermoanaerobaculia bacterium]|nr:radical SAM protein [Thermoanaerobaculia bacterium]